ncbi:MAG TPA: ABC transporter permease [Acidimicrobiales bacterium]|jgi:ABC-2 type transport system permease protein|nr:ABC transporter permease [Acidimicrobiales bacterium]
MTATATLPVTLAEPRSSRSRTVPAAVVLAKRRLALTVRSPRSLVVPLLTPVLFALVIAPALANTIALPTGRTAYMTFVALATVGLLIPLNCAFSGLGVIVDREQGAMRELLVAPIRRSSIVVGNLIAALALTALQLAVLIAASALRGAAYETGTRVLWFVAAAVLFAVCMYGLAEMMTVRLPSAVEYIGAVPAVAIVPFFFAGSLFPITSLPHWLGAVAKVLPLTHALALFRYGLTSASGVRALHNIWGLQNATEMALLSLLVLVLYAVVLFAGAIRLFTKAGTS